MVIHMSSQATAAQEEAVIERILAAGFRYEVIHGSTGIDVIGVIGDLVSVEESFFAELDGVDKVIRITKPYKRVLKKTPADKKIIELDSVTIGGPGLFLMAGPCSIESREQLAATASYVSELGIPVLRAGAYKPRTSPYSYQGMGRAGLELLAAVRESTGLKIITEATGLHHHLVDGRSAEKLNVLENVLEVTDILQIGARNMKSYGFLQEVAAMSGGKGIPILLKRGDSSTLKDFLLAAEYLVANGNPDVMLCLRGIRTFEDECFQRSTPDLGAIAVLKEESNLPVIFDPSHSCGYRSRVGAVALAAVAAGADGLLVETHIDPGSALCDGEQSVTRSQLAAIVRDAHAIRSIVCASRGSG